MQDLYEYCQVSKQAHYKSLQQEQLWAVKEQLIVGLMIEMRDIHPAMGLRTMYELNQPDGVGRDAFISIGLLYGFRVKVIKNREKTTFSSPFRRFKNHCTDLILDGINQLWTSDLTYFKVNEDYFYIVFLMDVYSRRILGYSVADNMRAENNLKTLQMALDSREIKKYQNQLIHHSDRGSQYIADDYVQMLNDAQIQISMCDNVLENAHIERVNGTIKNQYLKHWKNTNFEQLKENLKRAVNTYNCLRPHSALNNMTPVAFEQYIKELLPKDKPKMAIWTYNQSKNIDPNQCILQF
jgi:putative transposase